MRSTRVEQRRREALAVVALLGAIVIAAVVGSVYVIWHSPEEAALIAVAATGAAVVQCVSIRYVGWLLIIMAVAYTVLALGVYALHLLGLSYWTIVAIVAVLVVVVFVLWLRTIPAGTPDDPYDD